MECAQRPATSLVQAAFRSGSCDWEQRVFSSDMRQRDRRTDKAGLLVFPFIYLFISSLFFFCPGLRLSAARCPPPASISIGSTLVLSPLTCMAKEKWGKTALGAVSGGAVSPRLRQCLLDTKRDCFWKILCVQSRRTGASASASFPTSTVTNTMCQRSLTKYDVLLHVITHVQLQFLMSAAK